MTTCHSPGIFATSKHNRPSWPWIVCVVAGLFVGLTFWGSSTDAAVNRPFPGNGWVNPVDTSYDDWSFGQCNGDYVPGKAHLGADSQGAPAERGVKALAAGSVVGYSSGWPGDVIGIEHQSSGGRFLAVYGHIVSGLRPGATVAAGQVIGTVLDQPGNSHLHLGVRPLAVGESGNSGMLHGASGCPPSTYGYVNPLPWLGANAPGAPPEPDTDGDGVPNANDRCPNDPGPAATRGCPDGDGDGEADIDDQCPRFPGLQNTHGCPSEDYDVSDGRADFNGDRNSDVALYYDYGSADTALFVAAGSGQGLTGRPKQVWRSGKGQWELPRTRLVSGDFNGDGNSDVGLYYDYGSGDTALFVTEGSSQGLKAGNKQVWRSGKGNWELQRTRLVSGDFNSDGRTDVGLYYDYGSGDTALFVAEGSAHGLSAPKQVWRSGKGQWELPRTRLVSGDFNGDGSSDIGLYYDYGSGDTALFVAQGGGRGLSGPKQVWRSGKGQWELPRTRLVSGDFNGDGRSDVGLYYDYGSGDTGLFVAAGSSQGLTGGPKQTWQSGKGQWELPRTRLVSGDFNGDGRSDVGLYYDYGSGDTALFVAAGGSQGLTGGQKQVWRSGKGQWELPRTRLLSGGLGPAVGGAGIPPTGTGTGASPSTGQVTKETPTRGAAGAHGRSLKQTPVCRVRSATVRRGKTLRVTCKLTRTRLAVSWTPQFGDRRAKRSRRVNVRTSGKGEIRLSTRGRARGRWRVTLRRGGKVVGARTVRVMGSKSRR